MATTSYAPSDPPASRSGLIARIEEGSIAFEAGLRAGMILTHVDGEELHDLIDWYWYSAENHIVLWGIDPQNDVTGTAGEDDFEFEVTLERDGDVDWGIEFAECVFDEMHLCCNACTFCFMSMLPAGMRQTLYLHDDDFRLSFLQGNFVTLTNITDDDLALILGRHLSPLHVSLHVISPAVRKGLIGKRAARGLEVLEQLLAAGIEIHAQIVLVPGVNDGEELVSTLSWMEKHDGIIDCGIVPLGFTKHQTRFDCSFDEPQAAQHVIDQLASFQQRSRKSEGRTRFFLADEFYLNAGARQDIEKLPPAQEYDGFALYEDGIGMVRSFVDDWDAALDDMSKKDMLAGEGAPSRENISSDLTFYLVTGEAFAPILESLLARSLFAHNTCVLAVHNDFFGGNVDVTGLLTGTDILARLDEVSLGPGKVVLLPDCLFNACGVTLDDYTKEDLAARLTCALHVVSCNPTDLLQTLAGGCLQNQGD